jgi:hypothetical protein
MTQSNRTPFRKIADIPARLLTSDKLGWESTDGKHYAYIGPSGVSGGWWGSTDTPICLRPHGLSWKAAEALVNPPQPKPQPAKTGEPFRPGLPPAELRAVCQEWEWRAGFNGEIRSTDFVGENHRFLDVEASGRRKKALELAFSTHFTVYPFDHFRPLDKTWAEVEALAAAKQYRTVGEVLKAGLFDVCSRWYVKGHSEERRLGIAQERKIGSSTSVRVVKDLLTRSSGAFSTDDLIRPSRVTWEALEAREAELSAKSAAAPARKLTPNETSTRKHPVPIGGWVMRTAGGYPAGTKAQVFGLCHDGAYKVRLLDNRCHIWFFLSCVPCDPPGVEMPKNGNLVTVEGADAVVKEGCRQALQEERQRAKVGNPTYIVACPKGRRKYVKYYLSQHIYTGNKDLDALPYSLADKPFWLGSVSAKLREELTALAPEIRFSIN